jgi:hypothetical protein
MMYWRDAMMGGYGYGSPFFMGGIGFVAMWDLAWKGMALWRAARRKEQWWFIALLLINSMGLLPIAYLLIWGKEDTDAKVVSKVTKVLKKKTKK